MLQVFFGTDQNTVRDQALALFLGGEVIRLEAENFLEGQLQTLAEGSSLFGEKMNYLIDTPSLSQDFFESVLKTASTLASSPHQFVLVEKTLLVADKKIFTKYASSITEYKKTTTAEFNQFALTDALAVRDKRKLWLLLQESWRHGSATEEIIGILWWQLKTMRLASSTRTAEEAQMKDYPYRKAKSALQTFPLSLVEEKSFALTKLYHDARWGKGDLKQQLEIWVLSL